MTMQRPTFPVHALTADERRALRNELPGYTMSPEYLNRMKVRQALAEHRSKRLDRIGSILGGALTVAIMIGFFVAGAWIYGK